MQSNYYPRPWPPQQTSSYMANMSSSSLSEFLLSRPLADPIPRATNDHQADILASAIHVTLTSTRDPEDVRHLALPPGTPCLIGRASKTKGEVHQASRNNALFDRPVVSRQHAELCGHPWSAKADQVTIVDYGSMHGTKVNNKPLVRGRPMALRNGDVIKFGEKVTRGEGMNGTRYHSCMMPECADQIDADTHDGVTVTFQRVSVEESQTLATSQVPDSKGYHGQSFSDDDESDGGNYDESEDGWYSEENEPHQPSSAQTTPEQSKGKIGSQQNPIEVETTGPHIIDLIGDDDDDDLRPSPPLSRRSSPKPISQDPRLVTTMVMTALTAKDLSTPGTLDSNKVIQDSVDKDNSVYDVSKTGCATDPSGNFSRKTDMVDNNQHPVPKLHLADITNDDDDWSSASSESEIGEGPEAVEDGNEEDEKDEEGQLEDYDAVEEDEDSESNADDDSLYEPDSYQPKKQPSPELGSDTGFITSPASAPPKPTLRFDDNSVRYSPQSPQGLSASQPLPARAPYDPVRPSGVSRVLEPVTAFGFDSHRVRPHTFFGNGTWGIGAPFSNSNVSGHIPPPPSPPRLDWSPPGRAGFMPPPPPPPPPHPGFMIQPPRPGSMSTHLPPPCLNPYGFAPLGSHVHNQDIRGPPPLNRTYGQAAFPPSYNQYSGASTRSTSSDWVPKVAEEPVQKAETPKESEKKKISIEELVEDDATFEDLWEALKDRSSTRTKRKADEISGGHGEQAQAAIQDRDLGRTVHDINEEIDDMEVDEVLDIARKQPSEEPSSRRRRISAEDDVSTAVTAKSTKVADAKVVPSTGTVAGGAATLAGGVVLGGMATLAFLVSPLAEKALEWLA